MRRSLIIAGALSLLTACVWVWMLDDTHAPPVQSSMAVQAAYWKKRIPALGPQTAYARLAEALAGASLNDQHRAAHAFGEALYDTSGLAGASACDTRFSYGCWHEFTARAILASGTGAASRLIETCGSSLSCEHGIGHGLLAYEGYDAAALMEALRICNTLPSTDPSAGCRSGIFMEYNLRSMLSEGVQPLDAENPLGDCKKVTDADAPACYFALPTWWQNAVLWSGTAPEQAVRTMARWCALAPTELLERTCVGGIGIPAVDLGGRQALNAARLCEVAGKTPELALVCKTYAANVVGTTQTSMEGTTVCAGYYGDAAEYCLRQGGEDFKIAIPPPPTPLSL